MKMINSVKDVTKLNIPATYVLLEVVREESNSGIELPDDAKIEENEEVYSKVAVLGSKCDRLNVGDIVFMMQHEPVGLPIQGKDYILTYEDNCALSTPSDNVDFENDTSDEISL